MNRIKFIGICVVILSTTNCKKDNDNYKPVASIKMIQERSDQKKIINEKITELLKNLELDKNNVDQILPEEYIDSFGQTKKGIVGNIFVGCSIEDVINQLGKPTQIDIVTKCFIYFSQNIRIAFYITHEGKIKQITASDYSESYNLDLEMK
jgi:hypothetical protein